MPTRDSLSDELIEPWLVHWGLSRDGEAFDSLSGRLAPVRFGGRPAMLKVSRAPEEIRGARLMVWWRGQGAARVLAQEGEALLLERAEGSQDLAEMARSGRDDEASRILCAAADQLHAARDWPTPDSLVPLERWFDALWAIAEAGGGPFVEAATVAGDLLSAPQQVVVLHGDLHHGNVLDFGARGWLAIDPKGLIGERGYDLANIFCNPDAETASAPGRLQRQVSVVSEAAGLAPERLLRWIAAHAGLSASWTVGEGGDPAPALAILRFALAAMRH